ncbi:MAG TPA: YitT family protein [Acholeplasmataceae bacterium]|nr:YitT family protein [Acholeplasmataceae bacterium]
MKKIKDFFNSSKYREKVKPELTRIFAVIVFTLIYGIGVAWFLEASAIPMYTGGMPGLAQVVRDILGENKLAILAPENEGIFISVFILISNIPLIILGWFGVSKKFTIYSVVSVLIQSFVIGFIPPIDLGLTGTDHALVAAIIGGLLVGIGTGGALRYGTSTGGLDIFAQYMAFRKGKSVGVISMAINVAIALIGGVVLGGIMVDGFEIVAGVIVSYTLVRIIITTLATDKLHTSYNYLSVEIITENPRDMVDEILHRVYRGVTLTKVEGAYSSHEKTLVMVVISSYELQLITELIRRVDPRAFVVAKPVRQVVGNFRRKTIA